MVWLSAINHIYVLARVNMSKNMKKELATFFAGIERTVIAEKQHLGLKIKERKVTYQC